jgi:thiol-disulfide isomerase/thioredoxin
MVVCEVNTVEEFKEYLKNYENVVCCYHSEHCGPCVVLKPHMEKMSDDYSSDNTVFIKINASTDIIPDVQQIPMNFLFKNGSLREKIPGGNVLEITKSIVKLLDNNKTNNKKIHPKNYKSYRDL